MKEDPFKKEPFLCQRLDEYHVQVPDFTMESNRWERFISFLASPANNPLEALISTENGMMMIKIVPLVGATILAIIPLFIFF